MAGLPVLLVGVLLALMVLLRFAEPEGRVDLSTLFLSVLMIILAFRLRAGGTALAPVATCLGLLSFVLQTVSVFAGLRAANYHVVWFGAGMISLLVPLFAVALAVGGLRGWWWMCRNSVSRSF